MSVMSAPPSNARPSAAMSEEIMKFLRDGLAQLFEGPLQDRDLAVEHRQLVVQRFAVGDVVDLLAVNAVRGFAAASRRIHRGQLGDDVRTSGEQVVEVGGHRVWAVFSSRLSVVAELVRVPVQTQAPNGIRANSSQRSRSYGRLC